MIKKVFIFIILNFTALAIGSLFTKAGVASEWYQNLNKAPWTPPGYMFGIAWFSIMTLFAFYMAFLTILNKNKSEIIILYVIQIILNAGWNPIFFYFKETLIGLIIITLLTIVIATFLFKNIKILKLKSILILPYFLWLLIATSLNTYIVLNN